MNKLIVCFALCALLMQGQAFAFLYEINMLEKEQIAKLSDENLMERYIEAKIEEKASEEFHTGAGFNSAKEYNQRKKLLRYLLELRLEMAKRQQLKTEAESIDENLK